MSEVKKTRRNLFTIWLDYKKVHKSIPHEWLIYVLQLAKLPKQSIKAIKHLTTQWCTTLHLLGEKETIISDAIKLLKGIFQGDSLSVLLFILLVSFMLRNIKEYSYGIERTNGNISYVGTMNKRIFERIFNQSEENLSIRTVIFQQSYCP